MLAATTASLWERAHALKGEIGELQRLKIEVRTDKATVGGGSLPGAELPTAVLSLAHSELSADELTRQLRLGTIRLFCRIQHDTVFVDLRSVLPGDDSKVALAIRLAAGQGSVES